MEQFKIGRQRVRPQPREESSLFPVSGQTTPGPHAQ
jgi:hypothetical protein